MFKKGSLFGETNLINPTSGQGAIFQAASDSLLLTLSKEEYVKVVEKAFKRDIQNRIQFLKEFRIFKMCKGNRLKQLLTVSRLIKVNRGTVMFKGGDRPDGVYLIKEGAFEVTRPADINKQTALKIDQMNCDPIAKMQLKRQH